MADWSISGYSGAHCYTLRALHSYCERIPPWSWHQCERISSHPVAVSIVYCTSRHRTDVVVTVSVALGRSVSIVLSQMSVHRIRVYVIRRRGLWSYSHMFTNCAVAAGHSPSGLI